MCGIAGVIRFDSPQAAQPALQAEIDAMTAAIAHRGPDGHGSYVRDGVALGHRRLSIIDLAGGHQPMSNEDQSIWITFNGEIYNYLDLRQQLEAHGHQFASRSDTEVIVHAYEQWGDACVERFRGMFAFVIADFRQRRMLLARDHFGIKPVYYRSFPGGFAFASELHALRAGNAPTPRGSLQAIDHFFRFGYIPGPDTIYADVHKLLPGHRLTLDFTGAVQAPAPYWQPTLAPSPSLDQNQWDQQFDDVVRSSVQAHLISDVPFGVFLSGGIDSTLIAWHMSQLLDRPVKAFTIAFDESACNELPYAQQAAAVCGVELISQHVRQDAVTLLPQLIAHYGEPYADSSALPTWYVCRLARQHVPMVLSGDGGDEFFAGYSKYRLFTHRRRTQLLGALLRGDGDWPLIVRLLGSGALGGGHRPLDAWMALMNYLPDRVRRRMWQPALRQLMEPPNLRFEQAGALAQAAATDPVGYAQLIDQQTYMVDDILTKVDVASMCHGLEVRTPLIDRHVQAFAGALPLAQRLAADARGRLTLKHLPKRALLRRFPAAFVQRPKQGFAIPRDQWLARGAPMRLMLDDLLDDPNGPLRQWFTPGALRWMRRVHDMTGKFSTPLWPLLVLGVWRQQNPEVSFG